MNPNEMLKLSLLESKRKYVSKAYLLLTIVNGLFVFIIAILLFNIISLSKSVHGISVTLSKYEGFVKEQDELVGLQIRLGEYLQSLTILAEVGVNATSATDVLHIFEVSGVAGVFVEEFEYKKKNRSATVQLVASNGKAFQDLLAHLEESAVFAYINVAEKEQDLSDGSVRYLVEVGL